MKSKRNRFAGKGKNTRKGSNLKTGRDYTYDTKYENSPKQVKLREKRNEANKAARKAGKLKLGGTKEIHHKKPLSKGGSNKKSNITIISKSKNRALKPKTRRSSKKR